MFACCFGRKDVVKLLLDRSDKIDLNAVDVLGYTALMAACFHGGQKDVVRLLLAHSDKIDFNAVDYRGRTALMIARQYGLC